MKIKEITKYLEEQLLNQGVIVHKYKAFSTCSTYLKLDYGACNSIRISDHKGYDYLNYKYIVNNKAVGKGNWVKNRNDCWQYYCGEPTIAQLDKLIAIILADRQYKKSMYNYDRLIEKGKIESTYKKGFWEKCKEVKLDELTGTTKANN